MFAIQVELLTGRYYASRYNDRSRAEWPPHPARLFSALVATHYAQLPHRPDERAALLWLERQPPPLLAASPPAETAERAAHTVFVPVNDPSVIGDFDELHAELVRAEAEAKVLVTPAEAPARGSPGAKALAKVEKLRRSLDEKVKRATAASDKISAEALDQAEKLFPERRGRQPRAFPSVAPADPRITFVWPDAEAGEHLQTLRSLVQRVARLGHSASLVRGAVVSDPPAPHWRPDELGSVRLRVTREGQLASLDAAFELHQETQPHVLPASFVAYTHVPVPRPTVTAESSLSDDWVVLARVGGTPLPSTVTANVAKTIRRALMRFASQPAPRVLTGHADGGGPSAGGHLAIVGLPFVGHRHADGSLLGFALVFPRAATRDERREVFMALASWERETASDGDEVPRLPVHLGSAGTVFLQRIERPSDRAALRPGSWVGPARRWVSATPVALDRNPGELRERDPARSQAAILEAEQIVRDAVRYIGLPAPVHVTIRPHAPVAGAAKAKWFPPYPEASSRLRRVLTHVDLAFNAPVSGPVLLGAGRFHGLGLFKPVTDDE